MDFEEPLDKKGKKTWIFKDRFTCAFTRQVFLDSVSIHDRPDLLLRMGGAPWTRWLPIHLGHYTPGRVRGTQGAEQGEAAGSGLGGRNLCQRPERHTPRITPGPQLRQFEVHGVFWSFIPLLFLYGFQEDKHKDSKLSAAVWAVPFTLLAFSFTNWLKKFFFQKFYYFF